MLALKRKGDAGKKHGAAYDNTLRANFPHLPVLALKRKPLLAAQAKARQHARKTSSINPLYKIQ